MARQNELEQNCNDELLEVLEAYFPKGESISRGAALVLFAEAMTHIRTIIKAFGGCESCYGKGYSTSAEIGMQLNYCTCDRGSQLERIMRGEAV